MPVSAAFILENSRFLKVHTRNLPHLNFVNSKVELQKLNTGCACLRGSSA